MADSSSDTTPLVRESACPVHFLWDGGGRGRNLVRAGFLGFLAAGLVWSAGLVWQRPQLGTAGVVVAVIAAAAWLSGQALTAFTAAVARRHPSRSGSDRSSTRPAPHTSRR